MLRRRASVRRLVTTTKKTNVGLTFDAASHGHRCGLAILLDVAKTNLSHDDDDQTSCSTILQGNDMRDIQSIEANARERRLNNINQYTASREKREEKRAIFSLVLSFQQIDDVDELFLPSE